MEAPSDAVRCPTSNCAAQVELHGHNEPRSVFERSNPSTALAAVHESGCDTLLPFPPVHKFVSYRG